MTDPLAEVHPEGRVSWATFLAETKMALRDAGLDTADSEATWLLEEASGIEPGEWSVRGQEFATVRGVSRLDAMMVRRLAGEPIQYVLGRWAFRSLDLKVDHRVLIPRPETESIVDVVKTGLADRQIGKPTAVDLGTGSGAIALALAVEHPLIQVIATDASSDALVVARANLAGIGRPAARVTMFEGSWFNAVPDNRRGSIDVVVSNPPYISEVERLDASVADWEPRQALVAGPRGVEHVEHILLAARDWLSTDGFVVVEMASDQTMAAEELARLAGYGDVRTERDLAGRARFVSASMKRLA